MWKEGTGLDDDTINSLMLGRQDTYLSVEELVKYNIVDTAIEHGPDLLTFVKDYKNVPTKNKKSKAPKLSGG
jgi:hypothetical protein